MYLKSSVCQRTLKKRFGAKIYAFWNLKFYWSIFGGSEGGWQPDKVYFIHSETCHNYIINFHEHKTCLSKRLSTEKEKTSILDVIQSYYINKLNNSFSRYDAKCIYIYTYKHIPFLKFKPNKSLHYKRKRATRTTVS